MDVILYMRRSTDKQDNSIDAQRRVLQVYCERNKYKIVNEYLDEGISGRRAEKRPAFMQMIDDSSKNMFNAVLVYDSSRFARNLEESIVYKSILKRNDVELISATEPTLDDDSSLLTDAMLGALNEMFSRKLSKSVKRGMVYNSQNGKFQVPPPYGYRMERGVVSIVEDEAETVRAIYGMFIEIPSWHSVAVKANDKGLRTRSNTMWGSRDIKRMLTNKAYIGYVNYDGESYKGTHTPIIEDDLFTKVQNAIEAKPSRPKSRPEHTYKHWLSGLLKCGHCGGSMSCITPKRGNAFYRCHAQSCGKCKESNFVLIIMIEEIVLDVMKNLLINDALADYEFLIPRSNKHDEQTVLETQLKKIRTKLERHKAAYAAGVDTLEEYKVSKEKCLGEEMEIKSKLDNLTSQSGKLRDISELKKNMCRLLDAFNRADYSIEQKSLAAKSMIQKIIYNRKSGECTVFYFL